MRSSGRISSSLPVYISSAWPKKICASIQWVSCHMTKTTRSIMASPDSNSSVSAGRPSGVSGTASQEQGRSSCFSRVSWMCLLVWWRSSTSCDGTSRKRLTKPRRSSVSARRGGHLLRQRQHRRRPSAWPTTSWSSLSAALRKRMVFATKRKNCVESSEQSSWPRWPRRLGGRFLAGRWRWSAGPRREPSDSYGG